MPLWYLGAAPSEDTSLATVDYVNSLGAQSLSVTDVKQNIKERFTLVTYATATWAGSVINSTLTGQAFARQSDLTTAFTNKIPILGTLKSRADGPIALDVSGKVDPSLITKASTQTFPKLHWSPSTYASLSNITTETNLCTITVNPSIANYRVIVTGTVNAKITADGGYPVVRVRANNSTTGQIVATGYGMSESYGGGKTDIYNSSGSFNYSIPNWANKIDVVLVGAGGGGINDTLGLKGAGGAGGSWAALTLTRGGNISNSVSTITGSVGKGANAENFNLFGYDNRGGTPTTCSPPGLQAISAQGGKTGGGASNDPTLGGSPGNFPFGGKTYQGGPTQSSPGTNGNSPGGGGSGGLMSSGGAGADGAAFFYAYTTDDVSYGQIGIIPEPMTEQSPKLTGTTTLYVNLLRGGTTGTVTTSLNPQVSVMVVPA